MGIMKYSRLGDTFYEDKAKKINQALEKINAPYYQVCKKVRGSKVNKDTYDISWRKRNITCDTDYPNATTTSEKVVMKQLEKNFGISLSLLNTDSLRAIKKSLDFQAKQKSILDAKIKAKEDRERAAAERKALRNAPKTKTPTKTTATKSIPSPERNDNKEVKIDNNGETAIFYTLTKDNKRRNHAKLTFKTNRVQYLNSAVPMYVKDHIKQYKSLTANAKNRFSPSKENPKVEEEKTEIKKSSPGKSTKAVEEKKEEEIKTNKIADDDIETLVMVINSRLRGDIAIKKSLDSDEQYIVSNNKKFAGYIHINKEIIDNKKGFIIKAYKPGEQYPFMTIESTFSIYDISSKFAEQIKELSREYENSNKPTPKEEKKPINEPETTEIIKEAPPIMIDEDEAAKFDKGLDELTKLLQQAMQG